MIEGIFNTLYEAMMGAAWIAVLASVGWGVLSILLSPCHLSSIPLIVGFISSQGKMSVGRTFNISLVFSLGILFTIGLIGVITALLGRLMGDLGSFGNYFVAVIFFIVGLYLLDVIKFDWNSSALKQTKTKGLLAALILGLLYGLALGPCTFAYMAPVLGVVSPADRGPTSDNRRQTSAARLTEVRQQPDTASREYVKRECDDEQEKERSDRDR